MRRCSEPKQSFISCKVSAGLTTTLPVVYFYSTEIHYSPCSLLAMALSDDCAIWPKFECCHQQLYFVGSSSFIICPVGSVESLQHDEKVEHRSLRKHTSCLLLEVHIHRCVLPVVQGR